MATTLESRTRASLLLAAGHPANREAREEFARIYARLIREGCRRRGLQQADQDDVAQAVLCRLLEVVLPRFTNQTLRYDPSRRFRGLLHRMICRAIADLHRARQRRPGDHGSGDPRVLEQMHQAPAVDGPSMSGLAEELTEQVAEQLERDQRLHEACSRVRMRVEPHTWQAFWLTTFEGEPVAVVAERLGMTRGAVTVAKYRVTRMLVSGGAATAGREARGAQPSGSP